MVHVGIACRNSIACTWEHRVSSYRENVQENEEDFTVRCPCVFCVMSAVAENSCSFDVWLTVHWLITRSQNFVTVHKG